MKRASILLALVCAAVSGCASGYKQFYRSASEATLQIIAAKRATPPPPVPVLERSKSGDPQEIMPAYGKRGYALIGVSLFNSGRPELEEYAIQQGKEVGADIVLVFDPKYTWSVTSAIPVTTPNITRSYSTGSATAYGPGETVNAYGSGTTTTYGSTTNYVPFTINRFDHGAAFFVKMRWVLGVTTRDLNDSERKEFQSNKGTMVQFVVDGTPAFNADILSGDVITAIDGIVVSGPQNLSGMLGERAGKVVSISIVRNGKPIEKSVQLNP